MTKEYYNTSLINFPRWQQVLCDIFMSNVVRNEKTFKSKISKNIDTTLSHIHYIVIELNKMGLILETPSGRLKYLKLTEKGTKIAKNIIRVKEEMGLNQK